MAKRDPRLSESGWRGEVHRWARFIDIYRVVPRIALAFYMAQMWRVGEWAMDLKDISTPQTVFISTVYGAFPFILNFYMQTGNTWAGGGAVIATPAAAPATVTATATSGPPAAVPSVTKGN
jgi:hypothetical protein